MRGGYSGTHVGKSGQRSPNDRWLSVSWATLLGDERVLVEALDKQRLPTTGYNTETRAESAAVSENLASSSETSSTSKNAINLAIFS